MEFLDWIFLAMAGAMLLLGLVFRVFRSRKASREGRLQLQMWGPVVHPMKTWDWGTALILVGLIVFRSELNDLKILKWAEGWQYLSMVAVFAVLLMAFHQLGRAWGVYERKKLEQKKIAELYHSGQ
mgnify:CR=1 FL=1